MPSRKSSAAEPVRFISEQFALSFDRPGLVAGVDEAGRGPLAGPVVAAAVILDDLQPIAGLADSKVLTAKRREQLFDEIRAKALACCIAEATVEEIDQLNILHASRPCASPPRPSSRAMPRCRPSRRRRSWPRSTVTGFAPSCMCVIRNTPSMSTRATRPPPT
jgi:hypothetical protein